LELSFRTFFFFIIYTINLNFKVIREMMSELITWRKQIMSGTLPADEMKELKQKVTAKIDHGNALVNSRSYLKNLL